MSETLLTAALHAPIPAPEPGIYPGVPMSEYLRWDCASGSRLKDLQRSPAVCRWNIDHPDDDESDNLILGQAIHARILEPVEFKSRYVKLPADDRRLVPVKAAITQAALGGFTPLRPKDWDTCERMRAAIWRCGDARKLIESATRVEISCVVDIALGAGRSVRYKFRLDFLCGDICVIGDLKSCEDARPDAFSRAIDTYGYHISAALYLKAIHLLGVRADEFVLIAMMKASPNDVAPYQVQRGALEVGLDEGMRLLSLYRDCEETGVWPGLPEQLQPIDLPPWRYTQLSREADAPLTMGGVELEV